MMTINQQINLEFLDQGTPHPISKHMETVLDQLLTRLNCAVLKPQQKLNNQEEKKKKKKNSCYYIFSTLFWWTPKGQTR